jgi:AraC family transcriptional regulator
MKAFPRDVASGPVTSTRAGTVPVQSNGVVHGMIPGEMTSTPRAVWKPPAPALGKQNCLLAARSSKHFVENFAGPLSIKTVLHGRVAWKTDRRQTWVDDCCFLVLNDGEPYSMEIDEEEPVSTCCVFFEKGFVERVRQDLVTEAGTALDEPDGRGEPVAFLSRLHAMSSRLEGSMKILQGLTQNAQPRIATDEAYLSLATELLLLYAETQRQMGRIRAARAGTRKELFRRMARGREFLHASVDEGVTLAEVARASCLSPFHFHRSFTEAFGVSPSRYVTGMRMDRAKHLLMSGMPVTEACQAVGFESLGSFSSSFRRRFGASPSTYLR